MLGCAVCCVQVVPRRCALAAPALQPSPRLLSTSQEACDRQFAYVEWCSVCLVLVLVSAALGLPCVWLGSTNTCVHSHSYNRCGCCGLPSWLACSTAGLCGVSAHHCPVWVRVEGICWAKVAPGPATGAVLHPFSQLGRAALEALLPLHCQWHS